MADQQDRPKQKMMTEEEHKQLLVKEIDKLRSSPFRHSIDHGFDTHGNCLSPVVTIKLYGGDTKAVHALALKVERDILDFADTAIDGA
jgi:Cu/Ag efflux pump CusA